MVQAMALREEEEEESTWRQGSLTRIQPTGRRTAATKPRPVYCVVRELHVVNDFAERGVMLMQAYNLALTKDENQRQFLLQIVEDHRKRYGYPDPRKSTAIASEAA